jgi:hypothetical protein
MKKLLCFCLPLLLAGFTSVCYGQTAAIDSERMGRDIDIMEKVINELFENMAGNRRGSFFARSGSAQGSYVPGYGVIFVAPAGAGIGNMKWAFSMDHNTVYFNNGRPAPAPEVVLGKDVLIDRRDKEDGRDKEEKNKANTNNKTKVNTARRTVTRSQLDSAVSAQTGVIEKTMRDFLANYADAIGQLSGNERVMIIYDENAREGSRFIERFIDSEGAVAIPRINAEVKREDLQTYRGGKMNRKELDSRIKVNRVTEEREQYQEYKVFAGILETLFAGDRDNMYRTRNISYNYLPNFGVIYLLDMEVRGNFLRLRSEGDHYRYEFNAGRDARGKALDSTEVRVKQEAYGQFSRQVRESLLDYGRTLRNLGSDQLILLTVSLPTCEGCNVPERVNVSVKKSVLEAYEQNKMNRQQALEAITVGEQ